MVCLQAREAAFEAPEEGVARAIGNLCGEPDVVAARGHNPADTAFALPIAISISGVEISDAKIDRMMERSSGFFLVFVHEKAAPTAEGENRNFGVGAAERSRGKGGDRGTLVRHVGEKRKANPGTGNAQAFQEFSAG